MVNAELLCAGWAANIMRKYRVTKNIRSECEVLAESEFDAIDIANSYNNFIEKSSTIFASEIEDKNNIAITQEINELDVEIK